MPVNLALFRNDFHRIRACAWLLQPSGDFVE